MHRPFLFLALIFITSSFALFAQTTQRQLTLIYAAELPLIKNPPFGSYAQLATLIKQTRERSPDSAFLFGGGSLAPSMLSSFDRGAHIIDILNTLEPDAMGVANPEFSYFEDELSLRAYEAAFPFVLSNAYDNLTQHTIDGTVKRLLIKKSGVNLGVITILHDSVVEEYSLTRLTVSDPLQAVNTQIKHLKQEGAEVIVLMTSEQHDFVDTLLKNNSLDLVLRTDPHHSLSNESQRNSNANGYVFLTTSGSAAIIEITLQDNTNKKDIRIKQYRLSQFVEDKEVAAQIDNYDSRIKSLLSEKVTTLSNSMSTQRIDVRTGENGFGNLVTDALRQASHTDIAIINGGAIRGERVYPAGHVLTREDISTELPFRSRITVLKVQGKHLKIALENGLSQIEQVAGRFPHVSGLSMNVDTTAPVGSRIIDIKVNGNSLDESKIYRVATSDFLAGGGDGYDSLTLGTEVPFSQQVTPLIADIVISVLRRQPSISAQISGRIIETATVGRK